MQPSVLCTFILALLVLLPTGVEAKPRTFNSKDGKSLDAEMIEATETSVILRRTSDGKDFTLAVDRLSEVDQKWISDWRARRAPVAHPLGWKRLRIHAQTPDVLLGHATIFGNGMRKVLDTEEIYLPVGAWVDLRVSWEGRSLESLIRYDGAADWYVEGASNKILLRNRGDGPPHVAAVEFTSTEDGVVTSREGKPLTVKECAAAIATGAVVSTRAPALGELAKAQVNPEALILQLSAEAIKWHQIPRSVRALSIYGSSEATLDLTGIPMLTQLEHLQIVSGKITGMEALQQLPKLELLSVRSIAEPDQIAHLGTLTNLRHLAFLEQSKSPLPEDAFDCVGELTRLESAFLGSHDANDKHVNPGKAFRNCPNLTIYHLNQKSITDKGAFMEHLPKLTQADFAGGMIPSERALKLMDAGHFKHVMVLEAPPFYPLRNLPNLQRLITGVYPEGKNFDKFEELPSLREITLISPRNEDLPKLAAHPTFAKVEKLTLSHTRANDFSGLRAMPALDHLVLFYSPDSRADLSALNSLETVTITACSKLAELILPASLEELRAYSANALGFESTAPLPHLRRLYLENCGAVKTLAPLAPCPELTHLSLLDCKQLAATGGLEKGGRIERCVIHGCDGIKARSGGK